MQDIVLAIKPEYASLIFEGKKKVEIRKKLPKEISLHHDGWIPLKASDMMIYLYESSPVGKVTGFINVDGVFRADAYQLWGEIGSRTGILWEDFVKYLGIGSSMDKKIFALRISIVVKFDKPLKLTCRPPQNFMYLRDGMMKESL